MFSFEVRLFSLCISFVQIVSFVCIFAQFMYLECVIIRRQLSVGVNQLCDYAIE